MTGNADTTRRRLRLPRLLRRSLRARLVGYFLVLALATVAVLGLLVNARATDDLRAAVTERLGAAADLKADAVERWLDEQRRTVLFVAGLLDRGSAGDDDPVSAFLAGDGSAEEIAQAEASMADTLRYVIAQSDAARELQILDRTGTIRISTDESHEGSSQAGEPYFERGGTATRVEGVFESSLTGEPTIAVATPIFTRVGERVGVLASILDLVRLDRIVRERTGLGGTGETFLVSADGRLVSGAIGAAAGEAFTSAGIEAALAGRPGQSLYETQSGTTVIGVWRSIAVINSVLVAEMTQEEAYAPARELAGTIALFGLGAAALLALGVAAISRTLTRPILGLAATASEVARGNLDASAPVTSEDEVGTLERAFNAMTAQLRENVATLERRVEVRTAELQQRNSELAVVNEVGQALTSHLEYNAILEAVGERAAAALGADGLSIAMLDEATGVVTFMYWIDKGKRDPSLEGRVLDDVLTSRILETRRPMRISNAEEAEALGAPFKVGGTESYLGVPIPAGDRAIGVIAIGTPEPDAYTDADERLLVTLATSMGVALDNARLFDEVNAAVRAQAEAEARYRKLVEELPLTLYIDRPDEMAASIYTSPMVEPMFGYPAAAWTADDFFEKVLHPDDRARVLRDHVEAFARGDDRWSFDFRVIAADGRTVYVHDEAVVVKDEAGTPLYVQGFMQDVTERTTAEAEVRRQTQFLEALVEVSPVAVVIMDREEAVTGWNPAAERLFGYASDEAIGRHIDALIFSEDRRAEGSATTTEARERGRAQRIDQRMRKDGRMVDVEIVVVPLVLDGNHVGYYAIYHDISELEEARKAAETANQAKSAFLAAMSHEIRTPMNAIIGMSGLLVDTPLDDEQRDYAETIRASGDALLTIINDILDFSKIEAGKVELDEAPFSLPAVIEGALDVLAPTAAAKGIELAYAAPDDAPPALVGDAGRLRQILLNLLSNAVKFTETGEVVLAASGSILPDGRWEGTVEVRDTGIGIPSDRLGQLFRSFSQLDASVSRRYGGTGLGLAISRRLAELMDGSLMATSSGVPGEGSTFRLRFRAMPATDGSLAAAPTREPGILAGRRVLIVDDNATNRRILVAQTKRWEMVPMAAADGAEALAIVAAEEPIDVALLDLNMPELDGLALAERLRLARPTPPIPVIILSSIGSHDLRDAPVVGTLTKPVKPSALHDALADALGAGVSDAKPARAAAARPGDAQPLRILLAEDNAVNRKLALKLLEQLGYVPDVAANGLEAVEAVEATPYDVVLMDVQMPELDGLEATRRIRASRLPHQQPRIVAMTANAMAGDREACLAAGMDDYVSKPIRPPELAAALSKVAAGG
jgi:PAS domain S-box-containing protein